MRLELLRSEEGYALTLCYPLGERPIPTGIFTGTCLGPLSAFSDQVVGVSRWGRNFLPLSLEACVVIEAAGGARPTSVERFGRVRISRREAEEIAERFGLRGEGEGLEERSRERKRTHLKYLEASL